jgi:hypothetical protein
MESPVRSLASHCKSNRSLRIWDSVEPIVSWFQISILRNGVDGGCIDGSGGGGGGDGVKEYNKP